MTAAVVSTGIGLVATNASPVEASVENGRKRVDLQFANPGDQEVGGVAVTDDGLVVIAGSTDDDFAGALVADSDDALLFVTDHRGRIQWTAKEAGFSEGPGDDVVEYFNDVIVHSNGDIYVVGQIDGDGFSNGQAILSRYSTDGLRVDFMVWGDAGDGGWDEAQSLVEGPDGRIYVVGYSELGFGDLALGDSSFESDRVIDGAHDAFVAIFDPDLSLSDVPVEVVWSILDGDDRAYSITLDDLGSIYIAGRVDDNEDGTFDWFVQRYSPTPGDDYALAWTRLGGTDAENEDGDDRAWEVKYSSEDDALWIGGYLGNAPVFTLAGDPVDVGRGGFIASLDVDDGTGDVVLCGCNYSEVTTMSVDRRGHIIVPVNFDGEDEWNSDFLAEGGGIDSAIAHGIGDEDYRWEDFVTTSGDDEIVNSVVDRRGNLWLVGTTSGDLASSNGGDDDIFLSLYRVSDRRTSRGTDSTVSWSTTSGVDRFDSALSASMNEPTGGSVILVNGRNHDEVLAASLLDATRASTGTGRVLYLDSSATQLTSSLRTELQRIAPSSVTIVGDETSVSEVVVTSISTVVSVSPSRVTRTEIVDQIIESATPSSTLVLIGNDAPTTVIQAISWSNAIGGTVIPLDAAVFELERLRSVGFDSLVVVGSLDPARQAAISVVGSTLGLVARLVQDPTPSELSATMASEIGPRPDIAVVSPNNWLDAIHANSVRRPIIWVGPDCVQASAVAALSALAPTRSIIGFGGTVAVLGDPRQAVRC